MAAQKGLICVAVVCFMVFATTLGSGSGSGVPTLSEKKKEIERKILKNYDEEMAPRNTTNNEDNPITITTNTYIRSLEIDTKNMDSLVSLTFRNSWVDERLVYDDLGGKIKYLLIEPYRLWKPDIFFSNEKDGKFHNILTPNMLMRVYPGGEVLFSIRVSLRLSCPMDLGYFPADTQVCSIIFAPYGHTADDMILRWKNENPVQVTKLLFLRQFSLVKYFTNDCTSRTATGEYSCLKLDLVLKREKSYVLGRIYYPIILLVIMAYLSFWLNSEHASPKVMVSTASLLFATGFSSWQYGNLVGDLTYSTSLCDWLFWCHALMLLATVESVLVCWLTSGHNYPGELELTNKNKFQMALKKIAPAAHPLDMVFRLFYPIIFLLYNMVYWVNLTAQTYEN